jgi:hypothetical protein
VRGFIPNKTSVIPFQIKFKKYIHTQGHKKIHNVREEKTRTYE